MSGLSPCSIRDCPGIGCARRTIGTTTSTAARTNSASRAGLSLSRDSPTGDLLKSDSRDSRVVRFIGRRQCLLPFCPYSPKCLEGKFSEAQLQDLSYAPPQKREDGPYEHPPRQSGNLHVVVLHSFASEWIGEGLARGDSTRRTRYVPYKVQTALS